MRRHAIDARLDKASRMGRRTDLHRTFGPTHDLCRMREALDLMMGKSTDFTVAGRSVAEQYGGSLIGRWPQKAGRETFNLFANEDQARTALLWHWFADFFSKRSLPIPGASYLVDQGGQIAKWTVSLYDQGVHFRSLVTGLGKLSGVALTELILRIHIVLQRWRDGVRGRELLRWTQDWRYLEMFAVAHGVAAGVGAASVTVTGNPALLNRGAIVMAAKNALHLAWRVHRDKKEALDRFVQLAQSTSSGLDELLIQEIGRELSLDLV